MKVGDKVIINPECPVYIEPFYKQHGIIIDIHSGDSASWNVVKFADGVVENYRDYELDPLTDKEYFQLQLKG
jgi:hypothetical protein